MESEKYFWVIGGGAMQIPVIEEARALGLMIICSDQNPDCVCKPLADIFLSIDIFDIEAHIKNALQLATKYTIVGVLAAGIDAPETMAQLAKSLHLPGVEPEIAKLVHNKANFRRRLEALGFPVPKYLDFDINQIDNVCELANSIGYPLVLKNTDSSGSRGTRIFYKEDPIELRNSALAAIRVSKSRRAMMESFWQGLEQTVETLFDVDGQFHPCFITDRIFEKKDGFALETGLQHPSSLPQSVQNEMYTIAKEVAEAIGIRIGAAKYDFILTQEGPRIIEMTVRLSGGFDCQYLVPAATGKNIIKAAILTAIGQSFSKELLQEQYRRVAISRSLWPKPGRVISIKGLNAAREIEGVKMIVMRVNKGDFIDSYNDCTKRTGFIIIAADTFSQAEEIFKKVEQTLIIETE